MKTVFLLSLCSVAESTGSSIRNASVASCCSSNRAPESVAVGRCASVSIRSPRGASLCVSVNRGSAEDGSGSDCLSSRIPIGGGISESGGTSSCAPLRITIRGVVAASRDRSDDASLRISIDSFRSCRICSQSKKNDDQSDLPSFHCILICLALLASGAFSALLSPANVLFSLLMTFPSMIR